MKLSEFARRCGGVLVGQDGEIVGFATDSREVQTGYLFLCIRGANVDGHEFAETAFKNGAVGCLVERPVDGPYVLVEDITRGLAVFGRSIRGEFRGPVVGITGSNGKTSTKEFVTGALSPMGQVVKNEGNKNTELTSPLLWERVGIDTKAVVVEMGMRGFDQIAHLASIAQPTVGVITNVGTAHIEKVGSRGGIAKAKGELLQALPEDGVAVLWAEDDYFGDLKELAPGRVVTFGTSPDAWSKVIGHQSEGWSGSVVVGQVDGQDYEVRLPMIGGHHALNVAAAMAVARVLGVDIESAAKGIESVSALPMRMEVREINGATVLVDTYNASPDSTISALKTVETGPVTGRRLAVLGEMKELGDYTEGGHRLVGKVVGVSSLDKVFLVGEPTRFIREEAEAAGFVGSIEEGDLEGVRGFLKGMGAGDVVLIKGSRALGLEKALEEIS